MGRKGNREDRRGNGGKKEGVERKAGRVGNRGREEDREGTLSAQSRMAQR